MLIDKPIADNAASLDRSSRGAFILNYYYSTNS